MDNTTEPQRITELRRLSPTERLKIADEVVAFLAERYPALSHDERQIVLTLGASAMHVVPWGR